jgi:hypothetical protein
VDAAFVIAPCRLERSARIEFSRVRARAALRTENAVADAEVDDLPTELSESTRRSRLAYLASLPDVHDRTDVSSSQPALVVADSLEVADSMTSRDSEVSPLPPRSRSGSRFTHREESRAVPSKPAKPAKPPLAATPAKPPAPPHLWVCLEQRPLEAGLLILLIGVVILAAALAAAYFLR